MLSDRLDLVLCGKVQHALLDEAGGDKGTLDGETLSDDSHVRDGEVTVGDGKREDGGTEVQDTEVLLPVGLERSGDEKLVNGLGDLELLGALGSDELVCAKLHGLLLLAVSAGEDDDSASHLGGELNGQVTETTDTDDTNGIGREGRPLVQGVEDGGTTALEGSGGLVGEVVRDLEEESLAPDGLVGEGALIVVGVSVQSALWAEGLGTLQALLAVTAAVVLVSPSNAVADLHVLDVWAKLLDDTDTLVAEYHVGLAEVLIGSAETGGCDFEEDLVALELTLGGGGLLDGAGLGALEDGERDHCSGVCEILIWGMEG